MLDELVEHWTMPGGERDLVAGKRGQSAWPRCVRRVTLPSW
jgi:hypothetical protein